MTSKRKILVFESPNNLWYFHIQGDDGKYIVVSESFPSKQAIMDVLERYFPEWEIEDA